MYIFQSYSIRIYLIFYQYKLEFKSTTFSLFLDVSRSKKNIEILNIFSPILKIHCKNKDITHKVLFSSRFDCTATEEIEFRSKKLARIRMHCDMQDKKCLFILCCVCIPRSNPKIIKYKFSRAHGQAHQTSRVQVIITTIYFKDDC